MTRKAVCKMCGRIMRLSTKAGPVPDLCDECKRHKKRAKAKEERKKMKAQAKEQTAICSLCGREYIIDSTHTDRCPDCRFSIRERAPKARIVRAKKMGRLTIVLKNAKEHGMSYGKYVALMKQPGEYAMQQKNMNIENLAWKEWKDHLYEIVEKNKQKQLERKGSETA